MDNYFVGGILFGPRNIGPLNLFLFFFEMVPFFLLYKRQYSFIPTFKDITEFITEYKSESKLSKFRREHMQKLAGLMTPSAKANQQLGC